MGEEWRDIPGYEGRYQVSDMGRVRSVDRVVRSKSKAGRWFDRRVSGKILAPGNCRGYLIVNLSGHGTIAVHLLMARTFLGPCPHPNGEANHKDGVKFHNFLTNLEWTTRGGNQVHAVALGLKLQAVPVTDGSAVWPSQAQAAFELTGRRSRGSEISRVLLGKRNSALGRYWKAA